MTRLFTDGAESGDLSRMTSAVGDANGSIKRTGNYSYHQGANTTGNHTWITAATEWYLRIALYVGAITERIDFMNGGSVAGRLRFNAFGTLANFSLDDGTTARVTSSNVTCQANEWHVYEIHYKHAASPNGKIELKFDGTLIASYAGTVTAQSQADGFRAAVGGNPGETIYIDDIAVNDINGTSDNTWVGDGGVLPALVPTSTGTYVGFLVSGSATTWGAIDEIPANSTDFIYTSVSGTASVFNTSSLSGLPAGASISRIWIELYAKETAAVGDKVATLLRSGITDATGTSQSLTTAFARYESAEYLVNPNTSGTWSVTEVNSVQIGAIAE